MDKVLNQQEIDDMVRAARSGRAAADSTGPVVQPWDVRRAGRIGSEQLRAINQLHETFARNLTISIGGYLRIIFDCRLVSAEHLTYREFLQCIPARLQPRRRRRKIHWGFSPRGGPVFQRS